LKLKFIITTKKSPQ